MSDQKDATDKTTRPGAGGGANQRKPLSLNRTVESGLVQQKFSHGRSKPVVVEKKRKLRIGGAEAEEAPPPVAKPQAPKPVPGPGARPTAVPPAAQPAPGAVAAPGRILSEREQAARASALVAERRTQEALEIERARHEEEMRRQDALRAAEEAAARAAEEAEAKLRAEAEAREQAQVQPETPPAAQPQPQAAEAAVQPASPAPVRPQIVTPPPPVRPPVAARPTMQASRPAQQAAASAPRTAAGTPTASPQAREAREQRESREPREAREPRGEGRPPFNRPGAPRPEGSSTQPIFRQSGMTRPMIVSRTDRPPPKPPEALRKSDDLAKPTRPARPGPAPAVDIGDEDEARAKKRGVPVKGARTATKGEADRVRGKLTITNALDENQRGRSLAALKRRREREKLKAAGVQQPREKVMREVIIPEAITIQELANRMTERAVDVIKLLMKQGAMHKMNDVIDADTAELIVQEFGHTPKRVSEADVEEGFIGEKDIDEHLEPRAPVVTIMGHVDHGKTSLLDAIREANVASGEAGGITQHIGAYQVTTKDGQKITFIDTPGHEAFTAMRARGAKVTDIVVLVVAADDGVMPQTVEAINHAKAAKVPIIVAINKIDKPDADPKRVTTELLQHEIVVESLSGDVLDIPVSATKRMNLDKLLEAISLQAEILELKANPNRTANGYVIEAKLERGRGPVGTVLVERGTLHVGDIVVAGTAWGRVRAMLDDKGDQVKEAGPAVPVEVLGFDSAPEAGDEFSVVENEARAREITDYRVRKRRETLGSAAAPRTLEAMMAQLKEAGKKEFPLVIKGDVQGSVEAIAGALKKVSTDEVEARIIHSGVGGITESDVALANASKAIVIGFNTRANTQAKQLADSLGLEIRYYNIIYDLVDDVKGAMSGLLAPTRKEIFLGHATIKQVFNISKVGKIAGAQVTDGKVERGARLRLLRDNVVILQDGKLSTLKRFKDDVREVTAGQECGIAFENFQDLKEGDVIECFQVEIIKRSL